MITLKEWMEIADYRITEGSDYGWQCFGHNAYQLDSWNGDQDGYSFCVTFDTKTQEVYQVEAHDFKNTRAYRMINPDFKAAYDAESSDRGGLGNQAWDDVDYVDLEVDDDFIQKCLAIREGEDYSTDISIPINLPDHEMMQLFKMAHEANMTFNDYVNHMLREMLEDQMFAGRVERQ
jgi:hypothetical protein